MSFALIDVVFIPLGALFLTAVLAGVALYLAQKEARAAQQKTH